jgi:hypothetical protein
VNSVDLRVGRGTRTTLAEQIFDLRFRGFGVGAGEGTHVSCPTIFLFSVFLCDFRVFRVMIFTHEESHKQNRKAHKNMEKKKIGSPRNRKSEI